MWVCVCIRTHAHTAHGVVGCEPRGLDETLGRPDNPDGLNPGIYVFVYLYQVHMCIYMP